MRNMETLKNKGNYQISPASSGSNTQNIARTDMEIDTQLTRPRSPNVHSRVYFISGAEFIKIGVSTDPFSRLAAFRKRCAKCRSSTSGPSSSRITRYALPTGKAAFATRAVSAGTGPIDSGCSDTFTGSLVFGGPYATPGA